MPDIDLLALLRRHRPFTDLDEEPVILEPPIDTHAPSRRYAESEFCVEAVEEAELAPVSWTRVYAAFRSEINLSSISIGLM